MQMPPPPPSASSPDGGYLGIPAMSARLKALEERISRQGGLISPTSTSTKTKITTIAPATTMVDRIKSRNPTPQLRQTPSND